MNYSRNKKRKASYDIFPRSNNNLTDNLIKKYFKFFKIYFYDTVNTRLEGHAPYHPSHGL